MEDDAGRVRVGNTTSARHTIGGNKIVALKRKISRRAGCVYKNPAVEGRSEMKIHGMHGKIIKR